MMYWIIVNVLKRFLLVLLMLQLTVGCVETMIVGTASAVMLMQQSQSLGHKEKDRQIKNDIEKRLREAKALTDADELKLVVDNTRVILVGYIHDKETMARLLLLLEDIRGITEINNEAIVHPRRTVGTVLNDKRLGMQIKSRLLPNKNVQSSNFDILVFDHVAYIFGVARTEDELKEISVICATNAGITKVVSYAIYYN